MCLQGENMTSPELPFRERFALNEVMYDSYEEYRVRYTIHFTTLFFVR